MMALRLLLAEDSDDDAFLIVKALERHGFQVVCSRVASEPEFRDGLDRQKYDIILCDYRMPGFDALAALEILLESGKDIPLIIVSGTIGESVAVESMRRGAADYLLKDNLTRLGPAVDREIRESDVRRQKRLFDSLSQGQTEVLEMILHEVPLRRILEHIVERVEVLSEEAVMCCIFLKNAAGTHLSVEAGTCPGEDVPGQHIMVPIGLDQTGCGLAAATGENLIVEDLSKWSPGPGGLNMVPREDIKSFWAIPVMSSDRKVLGTMNIYHAIHHPPSGEELRWLEAATKLVGLAVERFQAAEKLKENAALLKIASRTALIGGWAVDFPEGLVTWSDQACAIHEVPAGTKPTVSIMGEFCAPEDRERLFQAYSACLEEGVSFDEEWEVITALGKRVSVRGVGESIKDETGKVIRMQGAIQDMTERKKATAVAELLANRHRQEEETARENENRYLLQRNALISLTKDIPSGDMEVADMFRRITSTSARTLGMARVSIWRFSEDRDLIECLDLFELEEDRHSLGMTLATADFPAYFSSLLQMELIAADDARVDPRTNEFAGSLLEPLGISSMMDVPIHSASQTDLFLRSEHVGPPRQWTSDEKTFALAMANLVSLALESSDRVQAQQEVLRSHQRFQSVASATNDTIWDWNLENDSFWWNDGVANLFGKVAKDFSENVGVWISQLHPDDRGRVVEGIYSVIESGATCWTDEYRFIKGDGSVAYVLDRGEVIRTSSGKAIRMVGGMTDLTASRMAELELNRSHRALRMLSSCNEMLIRASDENELLTGACRMAVEIGGYRMAWVGYTEDDDSKKVVPMAHAGAERGYLEEIVVSWAHDRPEGLGPAGRAVRENQVVVFEDIQSMESFDPWISPARKRGYRSVVSIPLCDEKGVFGVLCLYGGEPHSASPDEIKMLQDMASDLAFGIGNIRSRAERQRAQEVVVKVAQAVSDGASSDFFDLLATNMVEAMGATGGGIGRYDVNSHCIQTISLVIAGKLQENTSYDLKGTPCEDVSLGRISIFEQGIQQRFPDDGFLVDLQVDAYAGIPLFDQNGGVAGIMMVFFNHPLKETALVTSTLKIFAARAAAELDRQQADARIREQASLLDKAQDAILVRNLGHTITYWNKSAERLYGWTAEEAIGRSVDQFLYRDTGAFARAHQHTLDHGEWVGEMYQIDKHGNDLTIEGRWTLVRDEKGDPVSVFVINTDISEHRRLEQQFLRAQRLESIGTLAGGIAHDLNNILAPISMAIELLKMRVQDERSIELLDTVANSAKRGADMVGQVLSFARGMEGRRVEVHPRQLISEIETILRDTFLKKIELEVVVSRGLWTLHGDPTQLHQVLLNLCVNARDAISGDGKISIFASNIVIDSTFAAMNLDANEGPHICIEVRDTGEGIPPDILEKIYDPFFTTKSVGKGTGLGLSTSLAIVKSHGGFMNTFSRSGEGTIFQIYLPGIPDLKSQMDANGTVELPQGDGEVVLIVDDEESIRQICQQTLEAFGYRTLLAADGDEAVLLYAAHQTGIDAVITDMMMPGKDGVATIKCLRLINPEVKIIASSGISSYRENADALDVKNFLLKPYTAETLLHCLRQVLSGSLIQLVP